MKYKVKSALSILLCILLLFSFFIWTDGMNFRDVRASTQSEALKVNFQPPDHPVPNGYVPDHGETYRHQNGYTYGWNHDLTAHTVTSSTYGNPLKDPQHTFTRTKDSVWEIELENGLYDVSVTVGDAVYSSVNTVVVEGVVFFDQTELEPDQHATVQQIVSVDDGKLTVETEQSVLNSIVIERYFPALLTMSSSSVIIEPPPERKYQNGNHMLLSGQANPSRNAPPHLNIDGLSEAIYGYMTEQTQQLKQLVEDVSEVATPCFGCNVAEIRQLAAQSGNVPAVIRTGHLNLDEDLILGSEDRPVVFIVDGINTNQPLKIEIYGSMIVTGNINGNTSLSVLIHAPSEAGSPLDGVLSVDGNFHTNRDAIIDVDGTFYVQRFTNNSGNLHMQVERFLVEDQIHLNSQSEIHANEEIIFGSFVANNGSSLLNVTKGDFLISDTVHINSEVQINTGGWLAVGGNMTVNRAPLIHTGAGTDGQTMLKYTLNGLLAEYFSGNDFTGDTYLSVDENIQMHHNPSIPQSNIADGNFSVRWTGVIVPEFTETYQFYTETKGSVRLWVDDQLLIDAWNGQLNAEQAEIDLQAGQHYNIRMEYAKSPNNAQALLYWESDSQPKMIVPKNHLYPFSIPSELETTATENTLTLSWSPIFNAKSYEVEVNGEIVPIDSRPMYVHDHLLTGTEHRYRVRAIHGEVVGRWSPVLYSWTLPAVPENIELSSTSDSIRLEWDSVRGATSYEVEINNSITNIGNVTEYVMHDINPNVQRAFRVRAVNSSGPGRWSELLVKSTRVGVPRNLSGEPTDTSITLRWDPVSGADYYDLLVDGVLVEGLTTATYVHEHIFPGTRHEYRVRARNEHGEGEWSELVEIVTLLPVPVPEITSVSDTEIVLSWNAVAGAATYEVEIDGNRIDIGNYTTYTHSGLDPNSEHSYRVRAMNEITFSRWSETIKAINKPEQPLNVKTIPGQRTMTVTWDPVSGATGYEVEADGVIIHVGLRTTFVHESLSPNTVHSYRVRAENAGGKGNWSALVTDTTLLGTPELTVSKQTATSITLTWDALEGASGYELMVDGVVIPLGTQTEFVHLDLEPYTFHVYRLRANGENRDGEWSEALVVPTLLGTVSRILTSSSSSSITLKWEEVRGADYYQIEVDGIVVKSSIPEYRHTRLSTNSMHQYRIRAVNENVTGAWSDIIKVTTDPAVPKPEVVSFNTDSITLRWDKVSGAFSYDVEVNGRIVHNINDETYTDLGLEPNTMYRYRVRARGSGGTGQWSDELVQSTSPRLMINPGRDNIFNFVAIAPKEPGVNTRIITVQYDPDHVEVLDLYAMTPEKVLTTGSVEGTDVTITEYTPGTIVYRIDNADKTVALSIQLMAKTNEFSEITYTIE